MLPRMIRASSSGDSNSSKRIPFTVPAVPTGMKTGVSISPAASSQETGARFALLSDNLKIDGHDRLSEPPAVAGG